MTDDETKPMPGIAAYVQRLKDLPGPAGGGARPAIGSKLPAPSASGSMAASSIGDLGGLKTSATSQPGISKVTGAGLSSPLYTNEGDAGQAVAGIGQRMASTGITAAPASDAKPAFGPAAGLTITPFGGVNATNSQQAPQNEGLARMAAANATRQSMIDGVGIAGPASGLSVSPLSGQAAPQNEGLARMARANAITQERIDALPRGGAAVLGGMDAQGRTRQEQENDARSARWRQDELISQAKYLPQMAGIASNLIQGDSQQAVEGQRQQGIAAGINTERRGQDLGYGAKMAQMGLTARGQDLEASTARDRFDTQERIADTRANVPQRLTQPQQRTNQEIQAARQRLAGMDPAEVRRRTANFTATGRENPDFDPTLAKAQSLAGRRMYGADDDFDTRQQPQPADDAPARFKADKAMAGHTLGKQTELGTEVFDASGRLVGYYR